MTQGVRCPLTDLFADECDHCRPKLATFPARYAGTCATCQDPINPPEPIRERPDGAYEHGRHR